MMSSTRSSTFWSVWRMFLQLMTVFLNCIFAVSSHLLDCVFWLFLSLLCLLSSNRVNEGGFSQFPSFVFQFKYPLADYRQSYQTNLSREIFFFVNAFQKLTLQKCHILSFHKFVNFSHILSEWEESLMMEEFV